MQSLVCQAEGISMSGRGQCGYKSLVRVDAGGLMRTLIFVQNAVGHQQVPE